MPRGRRGTSHCSVACAVVTNSWGGWARPGAGPSDPPASLAALLAQPRPLSKMSGSRFPERTSIPSAEYCSLIVPSVQGLLPQLDCELLLRAFQPSPPAHPNLMPSTGGPDRGITAGFAQWNGFYKSVLPSPGCRIEPPEGLLESTDAWVLSPEVLI